MALPAKKAALNLDVTLVNLAREIAIDHYPLETILEHYQITPQAWEVVKANHAFTRLLETEIATWNSSLNTEERTKLKAAAMIEDYLPEAHARLHDTQENLPAKVELAKLVARIAGMGLTGANIEGGGGERFQININLGAGEKLAFGGDLPPKIIDAQPAE